MTLCVDGQLKLKLATDRGYEDLQSDISNIFEWYEIWSM